MEITLTAMPDALTPTAAGLAKENAHRRSQIATLKAEIAQINAYRQTTFDAMLKVAGNYPDRGWDYSFRQRRMECEAGIERLVYEIASLEAGPGYVSLKAVSGPEFRVVYDREVRGCESAAR